MWILILLITIGMGTMIRLLNEQSKQNKQMIEILEKISENS